VLFRLLTLQPSSLRIVALAATVLLMAANAAFNLVFFRWGDLRASFLFFFPYSGLAIALFILLLWVDPLASAVFGPYLVYFVYAAAWGYQVWRLNGRSGAVPQAPKIVEPESGSAGAS
jgi:tryptophan-rich sensory protein